MSVFVQERIAWSIAAQCYVRFHLFYSRVFMPERNLWRDFLVRSEEVEQLA